MASLVLSSLTPAVLSAQAEPQYSPYDFSRFGPWQPDEFEFWCGGSSTDVRNIDFQIFDVTIPIETYTEERQRQIVRSRFRPAFYLDEDGAEEDFSRAGCETTTATPLWAARKAELEDVAQYALRYYRDMRSPSGNRFSPPPLGPIVSNENGRPAVRLYVDPTFRGMAEAVPWAEERTRLAVEPWSYSFLRLNPDSVFALPEWLRFHMIGHELAHVLQFGQPAWVAAPDVFGMVAKWIGEGTSDALSLSAMRASGLNPELRPGQKGFGSFYGLRPYDRSLTWLNTEGISVPGTGRPVAPAYQTSSFWNYLADRYFEGNLGYLVDWFAVPGTAGNSNENDWLRWLDDRLRSDSPWPLYLVFPDFIGSYAAWGHKKYTHIGEETWLKRAFPNCHQVTVSPSSGERLEVELESISAACFSVRVTGVNPGEPFSVQWMVKERQTHLLDNLHLTAARVPRMVGGVTFECYDYSDRGSPRYGGYYGLCLDKPFTGSEGRHLDPGGGDSGGVTSDASNWYVKTWNGMQQIAGASMDPGLSWALSDQFSKRDNLYFLANVPLRPRDQQHDVEKNPFGSKQTVRIEIRVDKAEMSRADEGSKPTISSVNGSAGLGMIPMQGGEGEQADGMEGLKASILAAADMGSDPEAMSQGLFLQNMSMGTLFPDVGICDGVCTIMLDEKEERPDGLGGIDLETTRTVALSLEEGIPFGAGGTYKAHVSGCAGVNCRDGVIMGKGSVSVLEYNDDVLRLRATGSYCVLKDMASLEACRNPTPFDAEINKPFGWAYDRARTFTSIDTPGMAEYRKYLMKALGDIMPGAVAEGGGDQGAEGAGGTAGGGSSESGATGGGTTGGTLAPTCDCSCDGLRALEDAIRAYRAEAQAAESAGREPNPPVMDMNFVRRCAMQCAVEYDACGSN